MAAHSLLTANVGTATAATAVRRWFHALARQLGHGRGVGRVATIGSVAHQVGYGSSFALSTAFKRVRGISPQQYRATAE